MRFDLRPIMASVIAGAGVGLVHALARPKKRDRGAGMLLAAAAGLAAGLYVENYTDPLDGPPVRKSPEWGGR